MNPTIAKLFKKETYILILVILSILSIPLFLMYISYLKTPNGMTFTYIPEESSDPYTYISKMRQGFDGNILYINRYTIDNNYPIPLKNYPTALFIFFTILGNICRIFSLNIIFFYHLSSLIFSCLLIYLTYKFINNFIHEYNWKITTLLLCFLSTGYGFITKIFFYLKIF